MARISIFGLGYVGCVSAACLVRNGHAVIGVDVAADKVDAVNAGRSLIVEARLDELIAGAVAAGRLSATQDVELALRQSDLILICVGTPAAEDGRLDVSAVERVCEQIGRTLPHDAQRRVIVVRSTVAPGTTEALLVPRLEAESGLRAGVDFGVVYHPEFLREGTAVRDFDEPPRIIIGGTDAVSAAAVVELYADSPVRPQCTDVAAAEMIKLADNALHATKICFANEIGRLCAGLAIDSHVVMNALIADARGKLAPHYLTPAFAFGGSCLPKDVRALQACAADRGDDAVLLSSILRSNQRHKQSVFEIIETSGRRRIGVIGLGFKPGVDDVRDSPSAELIAQLLANAYDVAVYDRLVAPDRLHGANRRYVEELLPQLVALRCESLEELLQACDLLVITQDDPDLSAALEKSRRDHLIVDLVRVQLPVSVSSNYRGIAW